MTKKTILLSSVLVMGLFHPLFPQEKPLKDFAEDRKERKLCFYPSTLRMINLAGNSDFDDLVNGVEKLLIYNLDSATRAGGAYKEIVAIYQNLGYEEYASAYGGGIDFYIYGKERKKASEFIGVIRKEDVLTAFYMRGRIAMNKIPRLVRLVSEGE